MFLIRIEKYFSVLESFRYYLFVCVFIFKKYFDVIKVQMFSYFDFIEYDFD